MMIYFELFWVWFKMGLFTFGGGYAMLPMIEREVVEKRKWATEEEIMDYYAIGQCTPGIIAVNTATFVGYQKKGVLGGIVATLGVVSPSIIIISIIASFIANFNELVIVQNALAGVRIGVCVLMTASLLKLTQKNIQDKFGYIIFVVMFYFAYFTNVSTVYLVILAGLSGIFAKRFWTFKKE